MPDLKRFPMKFDPSYSNEIDFYVFHTKASSKHQYILEAIQEKIERDKYLLKLRGIVYIQEAVGD